jgi:hypothetical protein
MIPQSLGFVTVPTPGTPVKLSATSLQVATARIQPRSAPGVVNVGNVYIGTPAMNKTSGAGVYAVLSPEQVDGFRIPYWTDLLQVAVDADNAGDGVCVGYLAGP